MKDKKNADKLFTASCVALIATAMTFAIRANLLGFLGKDFSLDPSQIGIVISTAFWGFTLSIIFGGTLCDLVGMKRLLYLAFLGHVSGVVLTIFATGFWSLFISTLLVGIANGMVEAACNPLIATLYPAEKTRKLNKFHVWFPAGIVIGGLTGYFFDLLHISWQWQLAAILLPTVIYGFLFYRLEIPVSERVSEGVSDKDMWKECFRPLYLTMVFCMLLTSSTELGTNQWITELLSNVGVPSILLLVFINGLMALGRFHAGFFEKSLSPAGMLLYSSVFSALGLYLLSHLQGYWTFVAAIIFAFGICFFWPTMLGFVAEYLPKTGPLGMSVMGGVGMLSVALILPVIGNIYESRTNFFLKTNTTNKASIYYEELLRQAKLAAGQDTLKYVAVLPFLLTFVFGILFLKRKAFKV